MPRLVAVIPTFNRCQSLQQSLGQLLKQQPGNYQLEIVVVVDGSTDGTLEMLAKDFPTVHIVNGTGDWWYTRSMNEGFRYAERLFPDLVITLNDDIRIDSDYLVNILNSYQQVAPESIVGSINYTMDDPPKLFSAGVDKIIWWRNKYIHYYPRFTSVDRHDLTGMRESVVLSARGLLIPWFLLKKLKFFDERLIQYSSDDDFCFRARKCNSIVYVSWDARIYSDVEKTGPGTSFISMSFVEFVKSFFNPYARTYWYNTYLIISRHTQSFLWPLTFLLAIGAKFYAQFIKIKVSARS